MKKCLLALALLFLNFAAMAKYYTTLEVLNGTYGGTNGNVKYYSVSCGQHLKLRVDLHSIGGPVVQYGLTCDWYVDSVFSFSQGGVVEFGQSGLIYTSCFNGYAIQLTTPAPLPFTLNMDVHNFTSMDMIKGAMVYRISANKFLEASVTETSNCEMQNPPAQWYVNGIYYASTLPGEILSINKPGLITATDTVNGIHPAFNILLQVDEITSSDFPFPFSETSNISMGNLRYTVINSMGKIIEDGIFSGEIILRTQKPQRPLPQGIYFVIYYDALDNRQVLTDKVFVSNQ